MKTTVIISAFVGSFVAAAILIIAEEKAAFQNFLVSWYFDIIIGFLGIFIGFSLRFIHINYQIERQMTINAALELRDAFIDEMALLQSDRIKQGTESNRANDIIGKALAKHHRAVLRYGIFLPTRKRKKLESDWFAYSCKDYWDKLKEIDDDHITEDPFICYKPGDPSNAEEEFKMRKLALKRINKMLKIV